MSSKTVRYQQWMDGILELNAESQSAESQSVDQELEEAVRQALEKLREPEKSLVERRYLMGQSYAGISADLGLSQREIERGLREANMKLRRLLTTFVKQRFNLEVTSQRECSICASENREAMEEIIASKRTEETWQRVMRELRLRLGVKVSSPQVLIGHVKYHDPSNHNSSNNNSNNH